MMRSGDATIAGWLAVGSTTRVLLFCADSALVAERSEVALVREAKRAALDVLTMQKGHPPRSG